MWLWGTRENCLDASDLAPPGRELHVSFPSRRFSTQIRDEAAFCGLLCGVGVGPPHVCAWLSLIKKQDAWTALFGWCAMCVEAHIQLLCGRPLSRGFVLRSNTFYEFWVTTNAPCLRQKEWHELLRLAQGARFKRPGIHFVQLCAAAHNVCTGASCLKKAARWLANKGCKVCVKTHNKFQRMDRFIGAVGGLVCFCWTTCSHDKLLESSLRAWVPLTLFCKSGCRSTS